MTLDEICQQAHATAVEKGFWEGFDPDDLRHVLALIALIHTEPSEAVEAVREGEMDSLVEELADVVIRVADTCGGLGLDLQGAVAAKLVRNKYRPRKHGKVL